MAYKAVSTLIKNAAKLKITILKSKIISPTLKLIFLLKNKANTSVPSITAPPLIAKPIPAPKKKPPKTDISSLSEVTIGKKSKLNISAKPVIATTVRMAKDLEICAEPNNTKGIFIKIISNGKGKPNVNLTKSAIPIAPPSKKLLGNKKLFKPKLAQIIPAIIKKVS